MTKIILSGCAGRMGRMIAELVREDADVVIAAGVDKVQPEGLPFPVADSFDDVNADADVIIDFSSPAVFDGMMDYAVRTGTAAVVCTTGLTQEQIARLEEDSKKVAVLRSANMSMGINLLIKLLKEAAPVLAEAGFDIEIVEQHHNKKKDAPSGTAIALADSINESLDGKYEYMYDRTQVYEQRPSGQIGISSVRGGTIVGVHDVIFAGTDEVIELKHTAYSRAVFAKGAISAAKYIAGRAPGFYQMSDVIEGSK